jgi:hypothetical protein
MSVGNLPEERMSVANYLFEVSGQNHLHSKEEGGGVSDQVNHPSHYGGKDDPYEVIKVMKAWLTREEYIGALKFNIHKYLAREKKKGGQEDIKKAIWYAGELERFLKE